MTRGKRSFACGFLQHKGSTGVWLLGCLALMAGMLLIVILAVVSGYNKPENYPQLRSSESFLKLQDQLEGTENRLAVERMRYNDAVRELNTYTRQLGGRFFSSLAGVQPAEYFEIAEAARAAPRVDFSNPPQQDD